MSMTNTINRVIEAFGDHGSNISLEAKKILIQANYELNNILNSPREEKWIKKNADVCIAGAIISIMIYEDVKRDLQKEFGLQYLYPLTAKEICAQYQSTSFLDNYFDIGKRALIKKELPFTGAIDYRVFPLLESAGIGPEHFSSYGLNTDPNTMDTTKRSEDRKKYLSINKKINDRACKIYAIRQDLRKTIGKTSQHNATNAPSAATNLLNDLEKAAIFYVENLENQLNNLHEDFQSSTASFDKDFIKSCTQAISKAKSQLENDLDWGSYLQNLLIKLVNVVIGGFNKVTGKGVSFFETNVSNSVKQIEAFESKLKDSVPLKTK